MRSSKFQAPNSKEAPSFKFQDDVVSALEVRGGLILTPYWNMELGASLELGIWDLGFKEND